MLIPITRLLFGIEFGNFAIGDSVNSLDVTVYIDKVGLLHYLQFGSFYPSHVFDAVRVPK